ncbi:TENA/THI family protein, domain found in context with a broad range of enzyme [Schizosaccharomyces osmophilus]|uniref:TENA/THI family protein, domain found in context with a broad range of enzyme n=1 Tax=Schizosaccharomyces osmophilus TaxID=2545709 RepID=A0AAE9W993_9SCHI|nr:TENA/THI family protein, domain found in context with a broad range of enzyme [Schizosaccharomyces osmophilus]WBW71698.1 TENA/THI family protein, domain found in context with a broad range of enzyme [Schizosaccharomyces osmophilus]
MDKYTLAFLKKAGLENDVVIASTETPFIQNLASGEATEDSFCKWLYEDRLYVQATSLFLAKVIEAFQKETSPSVSEALNLALKAYQVVRPEIDHFNEKCKEKDIPLPELPSVSISWEQNILENDPHQYASLSSPACYEYILFVTKSMFEIPNATPTDYYLAFYMNELIYHRSWKFVYESSLFQKSSMRDMEFISWWANDDFAKFVETLACTAKEAAISETTVFILKEICRFEQQFFNSALS